MRQAIEIKNAISAYVFLITWFLADYYRLKETKEAALSKKKRGVAKKDRTSGQERSEQEHNAIIQAS